MMKSENEKLDDKQISNLCERVLLISVNCGQIEEDRKSSVPPCTIFMPEYQNDAGLMKMENLEKIVYRRLKLTNHEDSMKVRHVKREMSTMSSYEKPQLHPFHYLHNCYERAISEESHMSECVELKKLKSIIISNIYSMIISPNLFNENNVHQKLFQLINDAAYDVREETSTLRRIFQDLAPLITKEVEALEMLEPFFREQVSFFKKVKLDDNRLFLQVNFLITLAGINPFSEAILMYNQNYKTTSADPMNNILAYLLEKTFMITEPLKFGDAPKYFNLDSAHEQDTDTVHGHMAKLHLHLKDLFIKFINGKSKKLLLQWIGQLMNEHAYCAKLWTHEAANYKESVFVTDAIFMSLASVLVRLFHWLCTINQGDDKLMKIDPTFCLASGCQDYVKKGVYVTGLNRESCIVNLSKEEKGEKEESKKLEASSSYNLISECFFLAHRALYLGMHGLLVKYNRLHKDLPSMREAYKHAMKGHLPKYEADRIKHRFASAYSVWLTTKACLSEPHFVSNCTLFQLATCRFLNKMSYTRSEEVESPPTLNVLPEFIVENLVDQVKFINGHARNHLDEFVTKSNELLNTINVFIGSSNKMTNLHLRAALGDVLEAILPINYDVTTNALENFDNVKDLFQSVLQLYSDVELTGDPQAFDYKFNYRRPLYAIMKFMWSDDRGVAAAKQLALSSLQQLESAKPLLMLSFIDKSLNDAIFMMGEAFENLMKIKTDQAAKSKGEWLKLNSKDRAEKEKLLKQMMRICSYNNYNVLKIYDAYAYITTQEEFQALLCHDVFVSRFACMLNNYLFMLTGKGKGQLKVEDKRDVEFKPRKLVKLFCSIYANLSENEEFCRAVSQDERRFSKDGELFKKAVEALNKINDGADLIPAIENVNRRAQKFAVLNDEEESMLKNTPNVFFDPITGGVMKNPVILPSSQMTVDRSTILRHLLSEHCDPFTRVPLAMDDVAPNNALSVQHAKWIEEWRAMQQ